VRIVISDRNQQIVIQSKTNPDMRGDRIPEEKSCG